MKESTIEKPTLVTIEKDWSLKQKEFFELENLLRRCEAVEESLITVLQENRNIMSEINNKRIGYLPTSVEPEDLIQQKIITLPGLTKKEKIQWFK
jgi:hypothetical protein